jgi:hypothetical protein
MARVNKDVVELTDRNKELQEKAFKVIENILNENVSPKNDVQQRMLETAIKLYEAFK